MIETLQRESTIRACQELAAVVTNHTDDKGNGAHQTAISQLEFMRESAVSTAIHGVSEPLLAIVVQGKKEALLGEKTYQYGAGQYLVVSVDLPLNGFVLEATPDTPYLGLKLNLDVVELGDVMTHIQTSTGTQDTSVRGLFVSDVNSKLLDCVIRLTQLLDTPQDIPFLAPLLIREISYRLLLGEQGEAVRQIATSGSPMQRVAAVIKLIKAQFTQSLRVEDLATHANMSPASFHRHFKAVTTMSPLQYQKQLRLLEARRLMLTEHTDATHTAYQVGYESPSQFSREYTRLFGAPPIKDMARLRIV